MWILHHHRKLSCFQNLLRCNFLNSLSILFNVTFKEINKNGGLQVLKEGPSATALSVFWDNAGHSSHVRGGAQSGSHAVGASSRCCAPLRGDQA